MDEDDDELHDALKSWRPERYETEQSYERSLQNHLSERLSPEIVEKQITFRQTRADLVVWGNRIIELKNNLNKITQYHRLVGQLEEYSKHAKCIHLVICGDFTHSFAKMIREFIKGKDVELKIWLLEGEGNNLRLKEIKDPNANKLLWLLILAIALIAYGVSQGGLVAK